MKSIALILYGDSNSARNAFTDDNFKGLAESLTEAARQENNKIGTSKYINKKMR